MQLPGTIILFIDEDWANKISLPPTFYLKAGQCAVLYMYALGYRLPLCFYDISIRLWNCSDGAVIFVCFSFLSMFNQAAYILIFTNIVMQLTVQKLDK
jgi:hypothetical protein